MDYGTTILTFPSLNEINANLIQNTSEQVKDKCKKLLQAIADGEDISFEYLNDKYKHIFEQETSKKSKIVISEEERCNASVQNKTRCSRRKKKGKEYCGSHVSSRPFGDYQ